MTTEVQVKRLRIRAPSWDRAAIELRVGALVRAADLAPPAMPSRSILIVRRFGRGLPRTHAHHCRALPPVEWQRAVSDCLGALASRAVRPARGPVADDCEAVWFEDRAEMLACLAADKLAGGAAKRWWWQALFDRDRA